MASAPRSGAAQPIWEPPPMERQPLNGNSFGLGPIDLSGASFAGAGYFLGGISIPVGQAWMIETVYASCNKAWLTNFVLGGSPAAGSGTFPQMALNLHGQANMPIVFPIRHVIRGGFSGQQGMYARQIIDADLTGCRFAAGYTGYAFTDDINFAAAKTLLCIGDSRWNGTGPSSKDTFIPWMIRKYYTDAGIDCRLVNQSLSGSTSIGHETYRQRGRYDHSGVAAIFYDVSVNDASQATAPATFLANINALIAWKKKRYPQVPLVIFGGTPLEFNADETALVALRTQAANAVAAANDPTKIFYCSLGGSFDRTVVANYVSTDTAGHHVHPSDVGIAQEWNVIKAYLDANLPAV